MRVVDDGEGLGLVDQHPPAGGDEVAPSGVRDVVAGGEAGGGPAATVGPRAGLLAVRGAAGGAWPAGGGRPGGAGRRAARATRPRRTALRGVGRRERRLVRRGAGGTVRAAQGAVEEADTVGPGRWPG